MSDLVHLFSLSEKARELNEADGLRAKRAEFVLDDDDTVYLDGNSLGALVGAVRMAGAERDDVPH
ncbi:hypothetical protein Psi02_45730 [Planotetraspora silvatica]|uniref:Uncharacterized protein n=1 Tax=Planotetraspora silvatica TaxID=234614 RepID=A0A8J3UTM3_9ACTN|nr:hypothetical protein [Planotetraspora silvatica]GII48149.1 hypothetical protein Psi02_45730 [Planotetraspora silvatica]